MRPGIQPLQLQIQLLKPAMEVPPIVRSLFLVSLALLVRLVIPQQLPILPFATVSATPSRSFPPVGHRGEIQISPSTPRESSGSFAGEEDPAFHPKCVGGLRHHSIRRGQHLDAGRTHDTKVKSVQGPKRDVRIGSEQ